MIKSDSKKKFLIASENSESQKKIKDYIEKHISDPSFLFANDGTEAIAKIQNGAPHIVITGPTLEKTEAYKLTNWVIRTQTTEKVAVIILAALPETEHFIEEVITSQVQFVDMTLDEGVLNKAIIKALNFLSHSTQQEFYLRFLAPSDQLIKEGEKADNVYLVKKGELNAVTQRNNESVLLGKISVGEFVGEMAYINGEVRSADVVAVTDCELIEIPVNVLDQVLFTKPLWSKALIKTLSKRVKIGNSNAGRQS